MIIESQAFDCIRDLSEEPVQIQKLHILREREREGIGKSVFQYQ